MVFFASPQPASRTAMSRLAVAVASVFPLFSSSSTNLVSNFSTFQISSPPPLPVGTGVRLTMASTSSDPEDHLPLQPFTELSTLYASIIHHEIFYLPEFSYTDVQQLNGHFLTTLERYLPEEAQQLKVLAIGSRIIRYQLIQSGNFLVEADEAFYGTSGQTDVAADSSYPPKDWSSPVVILPGAKVFRIKLIFSLNPISPTNIITWCHLSDNLAELHGLTGHWWRQMSEWLTDDFKLEEMAQLVARDMIKSQESFLLLPATLEAIIELFDSRLQKLEDLVKKYLEEWMKRVGDGASVRVSRRQFIEYYQNWSNIEELDAFFEQCETFKRKYFNKDFETLQKGIVYFSSAAIKTIDWNELPQFCSTFSSDRIPTTGDLLTQFLHSINIYHRPQTIIEMNLIFKQIIKSLNSDVKRVVELSQLELVQLSNDSSTGLRTPQERSKLSELKAFRVQEVASIRRRYAEMLLSLKRMSLLLKDNQMLSGQIQLFIDLYTEEEFYTRNFAAIEELALEDEISERPEKANFTLAMTLLGIKQDIQALWLQVTEDKAELIVYPLKDELTSPSFNDTQRPAPTTLSEVKLLFESIRYLVYSDIKKLINLDQGQLLQLYSRRTKFAEDEFINYCSVPSFVIFDAFKVKEMAFIVYYYAHILIWLKELGAEMMEEDSEVQDQLVHQIQASIEMWMNKANVLGEVRVFLREVNFWAIDIKEEDWIIRDYDESTTESSNESIASEIPLDLSMKSSEMMEVADEEAKTNDEMSCEEHIDQEVKAVMPPNIIPLVMDPKTQTWKVPIEAWKKAIASKLEKQKPSSSKVAKKSNNNSQPPGRSQSNSKSSTSQPGSSKDCAQQKNIRITEEHAYTKTAQNNNNSKCWKKEKKGKKGKKQKKEKSQRQRNSSQSKEVVKAGSSNESQLPAKTEIPKTSPSKTPPQPEKTIQLTEAQEKTVTAQLCSMRILVMENFYQMRKLSEQQLRRVLQRRIKETQTKFERKRPTEAELRSFLENEIVAFEVAVDDMNRLLKRHLERYELDRNRPVLENAFRQCISETFSETKLAMDRRYITKMTNQMLDIALTVQCREKRKCQLVPGTSSKKVSKEQNISKVKPASTPPAKLLTDDEIIAALQRIETNLNLTMLRSHQSEADFEQQSVEIIEMCREQNRNIFDGNSLLPDEYAIVAEQLNQIYKQKIALFLPQLRKQLEQFSENEDIQSLIERFKRCFKEAFQIQNMEPEHHRMYSIALLSLISSVTFIEEGTLSIPARYEEDMPLSMSEHFSSNLTEVHITIIKSACQHIQTILTLWLNGLTQVDDVDLLKRLFYRRLKEKKPQYLSTPPPSAVELKQFVFHEIVRLFEQMHLTLDQLELVLAEYCLEQIDFELFSWLIFQCFCVYFGLPEEGETEEEGIDRREFEIICNSWIDRILGIMNFLKQTLESSDAKKEELQDQDQDSEDLPEIEVVTMPLLVQTNQSPSPTPTPTPPPPSPDDPSQAQIPLIITYQLECLKIVLQYCFTCHFKAENAVDEFRKAILQNENSTKMISLNETQMRSMLGQLVESFEAKIESLLPKVRTLLVEFYNDGDGHKLRTHYQEVFRECFQIKEVEENHNQHLQIGLAALGEVLSHGNPDLDQQIGDFSQNLKRALKVKFLATQKHRINVVILLMKEMLVSWLHKIPKMFAPSSLECIFRKRIAKKKPFPDGKSPTESELHAFVESEIQELIDQLETVLPLFKQAIAQYFKDYDAELLRERYESYITNIWELDETTNKQLTNIVLFSLSLNADGTSSSSFLTDLLLNQPSSLPPKVNQTNSLTEAQKKEIEVKLDNLKNNLLHGLKRDLSQLNAHQPQAQTFKEKYGLQRQQPNSAAELGLHRLVRWEAQHFAERIDVRLPVVENILVQYHLNGDVVVFQRALQKWYKECFQLNEITNDRLYFLVVLSVICKIPLFGDYGTMNWTAAVEDLMPPSSLENCPAAAKAQPPQPSPPILDANLPEEAQNIAINDAISWMKYHVHFWLTVLGTIGPKYVLRLFRKRVKRSQQLPLETPVLNVSQIFQIYHFYTQEIQEIDRQIEAKIPLIRLLLGQYCADGNAKIFEEYLHQLFSGCFKLGDLTDNTMCQIVLHSLLGRMIMTEDPASRSTLQASTSDRNDPRPQRIASTSGSKISSKTTQSTYPANLIQLLRNKIRATFKSTPETAQLSPDAKEWLNAQIPSFANMILETVNQVFEASSQLEKRELNLFGHFKQCYFDVPLRECVKEIFELDKELAQRADNDFVNLLRQKMVSMAKSTAEKMIAPKKESSESSKTSESQPTREKLYMKKFKNRNHPPSLYEQITGERAQTLPAHQKKMKTEAELQLDLDRRLAIDMVKLMIEFSDADLKPTDKDKERTKKEGGDIDADKKK